MAPRERPRGSGHKGNQQRFILSIRKHLVRVREHWHRRRRDTVESPSLEAFQSSLEVVQDRL